MFSFVPTTDKSFVEVCNLWCNTPPYSDYPAKSIANRLYPAFYFNQIRLYHDVVGNLRSFATWGFMTDEEFETRDYWGWEVFSRKEGDRLVVVDMIAPGGKNDVLFVSRDLRKFFKSAFPDVEKVYAHRGQRNGVFPNKGG